MAGQQADRGSRENRSGQESSDIVGGRREAEGEGWRIMVAGSGSLTEQLTCEIKARSLDGALVLLGRLDRETLWELYAQSTLLLHVSLTEGQPQVLYEAAAAGLPMVATAVGGVAAALGKGREAYWFRGITWVR